MSGVKNIFNEQEEGVLKAFKVFENKLFSEDQVAINYNKYLQLLKWRLKKGLFAKRTRFEQNNFINIYPESERTNKEENEALKIARLTWDKETLEEQSEIYYIMKNFRIEYFEEAMRNPAIRLKLMF